MTINKPQLSEGEIYVGILSDAEGKSYHLILLPGDNDDAFWEDQMSWAESVGGNLPNRIEQAMLFSYKRDQFKQCWYWSGEENSSEPGRAWYLYFHDGTQSLTHKGTELRARAVRRVYI